MQTTPINHAAPANMQRIVRSVMVVIAGFIATKGVSLIQTFIIADRFGAGAEYDTFVQASTLPDYIVRLIGGGALGVAFIPLFSALLNNADNESAWRLASQVFNTMMIVTMSFSAVVMLAAPFLVREIIAPGFNAEQVRETAAMMRILSITTIIFSLSGLLSGILHGHNHFFLPVLAPIFQDLGLLFGVVFFTKPLGIQGLAWGMLLGAILHFSIQIPGLLMFGVRWQPILGWSDARVRKVFTLMLPRSIIGATFLIDLVVIGNINSRLGEGAASAFSWGLRFMDIPQALLGTAVGIVIFPTLSALNSMGKQEERKNAFAGALRFILVTTIPATAGMILVSYPALRILFNAEEAARIFTVIQIISLAIIIQSLHEVLTRAFYSEQDTLRPMIFAILTSVIVLCTIVGMYQVYKAYDPPLWSPLAVGGPALGYVVSFLVEVILLAAVLRKRWGDIALPQLIRTTGKTLAATAVMVIATLIVDQVLKASGFGIYVTSRIVIRLLVLVVTGMISFIVAAWLVGVEELKLIPQLLPWRKS